MAAWFQAVWSEFGDISSLWQKNEVFGKNRGNTINLAKF